MKDYTKLKDYRKKYKIHYGINFGKNYVVHHIDGNRENNDISNLILLPRDLHSKYHEYKKQVELYLVNNKLNLLLGYCNSMERDLRCSILDSFVYVTNQIAYWENQKFLADVNGIAYEEFREG